MKEVRAGLGCARHRVEKLRIAHVVPAARGVGERSRLRWAERGRGGGGAAAAASRVGWLGLVAALAAESSGNVRPKAVDVVDAALGDNLISTSFCCINATSLSSSVLRVSIGNVPELGKSLVLDVGRFLRIVYLSFTVAPPPKVTLPPPVTPAPVTEY